MSVLLNLLLDLRELLLDCLWRVLSPLGLLDEALDVCQRLALLLHPGLFEQIFGLALLQFLVPSLDRLLQLSDLFILLIDGALLVFKSFIQIMDMFRHFPV